ncbi:MAG: hypothetical protein LBV33_06140 [Lachnospiraceae bacterium]|nr:hypothetical protein [Lachnospiraceae bacterium]
MQKYKGVVAIVLVALMGLFLTLAVIISTGRTDREPLDRAAEQEYRKELRAFLDQAGFSNSGVSMTRAVTRSTADDQEDGEVCQTEYKVLIYHKLIWDLNRTEMSQLLEDITEIDVPMSGCSISYQFEAP